MIIVEVILLVLVVAALYFALRFLANKTWIMGWIRGCVGLGFVLLAVFFVLVALDFFSYEKLLEEKPLATLSVEQLESQHYKVSVDYIVDGSQVDYEIKGDLWQMDAKIIRWLGLFQAIGAKPGYRLDRISGRYYSIEDEHRNERTVHQLQESKYGLDVWAWLQNNGKYFPWVDAVYGSATYLPLKDGAIYQVSLSNTGLVALPVNKVAEEAVGSW